MRSSILMLQPAPSLPKRGGTQSLVVARWVAPLPKKGAGNRPKPGLRPKPGGWQPKLQDWPKSLGWPKPVDFPFWLSWSPPARSPTLRNGAATRPRTTELAVRGTAEPFQRGERLTTPEG